MSTPSPYAPVVLPFDARDQIERALLGRTSISGASAVMSLLMQWPCIAPPATEDPAPREPRVWRKGDDEPPAGVDILWDPISEGEAYLCRLDDGTWEWFDNPEDRTGVRYAAPWNVAMQDSDGPLSEVPASPATGGKT